MPGRNICAQIPRPRFPAAPTAPARAYPNSSAGLPPQSLPNLRYRKTLTLILRREFAQLSPALGEPTHIVSPCRLKARCLVLAPQRFGVRQPCCRFFQQLARFYIQRGPIESAASQILIFPLQKSNLRVYFHLVNIVPGMSYRQLPAGVFVFRHTLNFFRISVYRPSVTADSKALTETLTPLDATLAKNRGRGSPYETVLCPRLSPAPPFQRPDVSNG